VLTVSEAAKKLNFSEQHVRRLIAQKRLPAVKQGRDWVIHSLVIHPPLRPVGRPKAGK